ncbi:MAG: hypothetical protein AAB425_10330, partial [Bdellovibrionota bacterium]
MFSNEISGPSPATTVTVKQNWTYLAAVVVLVVTNTACRSISDSASPAAAIGASEAIDVSPSPSATSPDLDEGIGTLTASDSPFPTTAFSPNPNPIPSAIPVFASTSPAAGEWKACEKSGNPITFTELVTDVDSLKYVTPLPALAGGAVFEGRSYMMVKDELMGIRIPIRAPTRMTLKSTSHYIPPGAPAGYEPEWALTFDIECSDVGILFAHIKVVVDRIREVSDETVSQSSATQMVKKEIQFEAGEVIGYFIRGKNSLAWDFLVTDWRIENRFANQARYRKSGDKLLHVICPFQLYPEKLQRQFLDRLGDFGGTQTPGMTCGTVARDVPGT